jgi:antitoxin component YwqK of YwqJK toxin-antitoxin module
MTDQMDKKTVTATYCTTNECKELKAIREICTQYTDDPSYVYKYCEGHLVVMQKTEDTLTNESRSGVADPMYAKYRASELMVVRIIRVDHFDPTIDEIINFSRFENYATRMLYQVGTIARPDGFDQNLENVCSNGVHYFKSLERAFYYGHYTMRYQITGQWVGWGDSGLMTDQSYYVFGRMSGRSKKWCDGILVRCANYVDGSLDGEMKTYYNDGTVHMISNYKLGYLDGPSVEYLPCGTIRYRGNYSNDMRHGCWTIYHTNGLREKVSQYKDGLLDGLCCGYNDKGVLIEETVYQNNRETGIYKYYYDDGSIKSIGNQINGFNNGLCKEYYPNGLLKTYIEYSRGDFNGMYKSYYPDGQIDVDCRYVDHSLTGMYKKYYPDGTLHKTCNYVYAVGTYDSQLDGQYREYHNNGKLYKECVYKQGVLDGRMVEYNLFGQIVLVCYYKNGIRSTVWEDQLRG